MKFNGLSLLLMLEEEDEEIHIDNEVVALELVALALSMESYILAGAII